MNKLGNKWFNNGIEQKCCSACPEGWICGRLPVSEQTKINRSEGQKRRWKNATEDQLLARVKSFHDTLNKRTEKDRKKVSAHISEATKGKHIGRIPWNKGKKNVQIAWNKGLKQPKTQEQIDQMVARREATMLKNKTRYGTPGRIPWNKNVPTGPWSEENKVKILAKQYTTKKNNNSFNKSSSEENIYNYLVNIYNKENVIRQYSNDKYPFSCDFYIKPLDLFIEVNYHWTHGRMLFNPKNKKCRDQLKEWEIKANSSSFYINAINTWTIRDVDKYNYAKQNNLNYLILYPQDNLKLLDHLEIFCKETPFPFINSDFSNKSDLGLIHYFHKSIYEANIKGRKSPIEAWKDKDLVKQIALNRIKYIGDCRPKDIVQGFNVTQKAKKVSVFNPILAYKILSKYASDTNNIFDPFSGFSGRLIACYKLDKHYIGQDISEKHINESKQIVEYLHYTNCKLITQDILTDSLKEFSDTALFTCPPYKDKEHWLPNGDERINNCDQWIDICLTKYKCNKYIFIVDSTKKYKDYIVEEIVNKSHFGKNKEYIIVIEK